MPKFEYKAIEPSGSGVSGLIDSNSVEGALEALRDKNFLPLQVHEKHISKKKSFDLFGQKGKIKQEELYNLCRELYILLKSGIKLDKALTILKNTEEDENIAGQINGVLEKIKQGSSLSLALKEVKNFFPEIYLNIVGIGEKTGDLAGSFKNISDFIYFNVSTSKQIKNALVYPSFLLIVSFITIGVLFTNVIPRFLSAFGTNVTKNLPWISRALISVSNALEHHTLIIGLIAAGICVLIIKSIKSREGRELMIKFWSKIPLIREIINLMDISRFTYTLSLMLSSGVDLLEAISHSIKVIRNPYMAKDMKQVSKDIKEGGNIGGVLKRIRDFPDAFVSMIEVGEESGNLTEVLDEIHHSVNDKFQTKVKRALSLFEPIVISVVGIIVGLIVVAVILTIMSANTFQL